MVLGYIDVEALAGLGIGFGLVVVLPLVVVLLAHQRKMAELMRKPPGQDVESKMLHMQSQIDDLRMRTADQALAIEQYRSQLGQSNPDRPPRRVEI